eukprot:753363-Hanusia_phi.AAC.1
MPHDDNAMASNRISKVSGTASEHHTSLQGSRHYLVPKASLRLQHASSARHREVDDPFRSQGSRCWRFEP